VVHRTAVAEVEDPIAAGLVADPIVAGERPTAGLAVGPVGTGLEGIAVGDTARPSIAAVPEEDSLVLAVGLGSPGQAGLAGVRGASR
jgi:hypothetical protein